MNQPHRTPTQQELDAADFMLLVQAKLAVATLLNKVRADPAFRAARQEGAP